MQKLLLVILIIMIATVLSILLVKPLRDGAGERQSAVHNSISL